MYKPYMLLRNRFQRWTRRKNKTGNEDGERRR